MSFVRRTVKRRRSSVVRDAHPQNRLNLLSLFAEIILLETQHVGLYTGASHQLKS